MTDEVVLLETKKYKCSMCKTSQSAGMVLRVFDEVKEPNIITLCPKCGLQHLANKKEEMRMMIALLLVVEKNRNDSVQLVDGNGKS